MRTNSKGRKSSRRFWIYGYHPVKAALLNTERKTFRLVLTQNSAKRLSDEIGFIDNLKPEIRTTKFFTELLGSETTHQGFALELSPLEEKGLDCVDFSENPMDPIVILDQITDPHNVGAILRSSEAFFGKAVITTSRNTPSESGVLAKASSGAIERIPLVKVINLVAAMEKLKDLGFWLIGLDIQGDDELEPILQKTSDVQIGFVMGAEGKGLRESVKKKCDYLAKIPINKAINSLNVSNAASICLYSAYRIRNIKNIG